MLINYLIFCYNHGTLKRLLVYKKNLSRRAANFYVCCSTGSPSSKYEHRRASALLRDICNIRICMGKKPIVSVTYENERISIKNSLPHLKCVLRLSCVVHETIYSRFIGFYVNGFLSTDLQPLIRCRCNGVLKQDNEWKGELSCVI